MSRKRTLVQQKLVGSETSKLINILHNLEPMQLDWKKYHMDTRARFFIEYADGSGAEDYYIDVDNKHVQKGQERGKEKFYKASKELLDEMNRLGIPTSLVKRETFDH